MTYLVHSSHAQLGALWLGTVGWVLTAMTLGLIQWRVWLVDDLSAVSSGVAWVGVWRVCFYSRTLPTPTFHGMFCRSMGLAEPATPPEVAAAQVLMLLAVGAGFCGNGAAVYALRNVYFGLEKAAPIRRAFATAGALCLLTAALALVPLLWNVKSVVTNQTIPFPPEFHMPPAPVAQIMGPALWVGLVGSTLLIISGVIFLRYRLPVRRAPRVEPACPEGRSTRDAKGHVQARDNPAFQPDEAL